MWDTLEMIYRGLPNIEQEKMNTQGKEDEDTNLGCFSKCSKIGNYVGNHITNKFLRVKNWNFNPTLKSEDRNLHKFQEKSRKQEIKQKLNKIDQLLKDEGIQTKESSFSPYYYHKTLVESFERTCSVVEQYSKYSTSIEGPYFSRNDKEEDVSSILKRRRGGDISTSGRNMKQLSSNEENEIFLKASYEEDTTKVTKSFYEQLFKMGSQLVKENDKLKEHDLVIKELLESLEEVNKSFKIEITKIRNSRE